MSRLVLPSSNSVASRINWSNALSKKLIFAWKPGALGDLVYRNRFIVNSRNETITAFGKCTNPVGIGGKYLRTIVSASDDLALLYDDQIITLFGLFRQRTETNAGYGFLRANGSNTATWGIGLHGGSFDGPTAKLGSYSYIPTTADSTMVEKVHTVCIAGDGSRLDLYYDKNKVITNQAYTPTTPEYNNTLRTLLIGASSGSFGGSNTECYLALAFKGRISEDEYFDLEKNPWQLFTPQKRVIYFDGAGAGGATANAALPHISLLAAATTVSASANPSAALTVATLQPAIATASVSASRSTGLPFATLTAPNATASASSGVVANASLPHASLMVASASASGTLSATANTALPFATLQIASALAGVSSLASASLPHAVLFPAQASSTISALTLTADDIQAIADAVWGHSQALQCHTLMTEVWGRLGLDPAKPLITGANQISFGAIVMTMAEISNQVTVTRQ